MKWSKNLELKFRVYVRQHEDIEFRMNEMGARLEDTMLGKANLLTIGEEIDYFWPVRPEQVGDYQERGFLLTEKEGVTHIVVRELPISIDSTDYELDDLMEILKDEFSEGLPFAVISYVESALTEIQAV